MRRVHFACFVFDFPRASEFGSSAWQCLARFLVDLAFVPVGRDPPAFRIPEGNLDKTLFETIPDNQMSLSCTGHAQARAAGQELRKLLQDENLYCFVSPFLRTVQTLSGVLEAFPEEQIAGIREDSRYAPRPRPGFC